MTKVLRMVPREHPALDDLLHLLAVQVRKLQDNPTDTLRLSIKRTFDKVMEVLW